LQWTDSLVQAPYELVEKWHWDPVAFAEDCLWTPFGKVKLYPEQKKAIREACRLDDNGVPVYKTVVFSYPKRDGKSFNAVIIILWRFCTWLTQASTILSNSRDQSKSVIMDECVDIIKASPSLNVLIGDADKHIKIRGNFIAWPSRGNEITCMPARSATVQGRAVTGICAIDELHEATEDIQEAAEFLMSQTEASSAQNVISSQIGAKTGPVYNYYRMYLNGEPRLFVDYRTENKSPFVTKEWLEGRKAALAHKPGRYEYLHMNLPLSGGQLLVSPTTLNEAKAIEVVDNEMIPLYKMSWPPEDIIAVIERKHPFHKLIFGVGLDKASDVKKTKGDDTVLSVVCKVIPGPPPQLPEDYEDDSDAVLLMDLLSAVYEDCVRSAIPEDEDSPWIAHYYLVRQKVLNDDVALKRAVQRAYDDFKFRALAVERPEASDFIKWAIRHRWGGPRPVVTVENPTLANQDVMFGEFMGKLWHLGLIKFPIDATLLEDQLSAFLVDLTKAIPRYGHDTGAHDDAVYSHAYACWAVRDIISGPTTKKVTVI